MTPVCIVGYRGATIRVYESVRVVRLRFYVTYSTAVRSERRLVDCRDHTRYFGGVNQALAAGKERVDMIKMAS